MEATNVEERIKLEKNTKGYNWELSIRPIKVTDHETGEVSRDICFTDIDRLVLLNNEMIKRFGNEIQ